MASGLREELRSGGFLGDAGARMNWFSADMNDGSMRSREKATGENDGKGTGF